MSKLPTPSGSVGTWGAELNDFLKVSHVASTTDDIVNGLLKEDHASITRGGKVGIGTSTPAAILEVASQGTTSTSTILRGGTAVPGSGNSTSGSYFNFSTNEDTYIRGGVATSKVNINDLGTGNTLINAIGGNVGLGINTPTEKLHVNGNVAANFYKFTNTTSKAKIQQVVYPSGTNDNFQLQLASTAGPTVFIPFNASVDYTNNSILTILNNLYAPVAGVTYKNIFTIQNLPTFATDAAAGVGGLLKDAIYITTTGEIRIKL